MTFAIYFAATERRAVQRGDRDGATRFGGAADTGAILTNYHVFRHFWRGTVRRDDRRGGAFVVRDIGGGSDKRPPLVCAVFSGTINCPLPLATALPSMVLLLSRIVTVAPASA